MRPTSTSERRGDVKASGNLVDLLFMAMSFAHLVGFVHILYFALFFPGLVHGWELKVDVYPNAVDHSFPFH